MKILFRTSNDFAREELREMVTDMNGQAFFAADADDAVRIMNHHQINMLFLEMRHMADVGLLQYANENFSHTRIVLIADDALKNAVSALQTGEFRLLKKNLESQ